jgi:hypothetical protein
MCHSRTSRTSPSSRPEGVPEHLFIKRLQIMGRIIAEAPPVAQPVFPDPRTTTRRQWEKALFEIRRQVRDTQRDGEARAMSWLRAKAEAKAQAKPEAKAKPEEEQKDSGGEEKKDGEAALTKKQS